MTYSPAIYIARMKAQGERHERGEEGQPSKLSTLPQGVCVWRNADETHSSARRVACETQSAGQDADAGNEERHDRNGTTPRDIAISTVTAARRRHPRRRPCGSRAVRGAGRLQAARGRPVRAARTRTWPARAHGRSRAGCRLRRPSPAVRGQERTRTRTHRHAPQDHMMSCARPVCSRVPQRPLLRAAAAHVSWGGSNSFFVFSHFFLGRFADGLQRTPASTKRRVQAPAAMRWR